MSDGTIFETLCETGAAYLWLPRVTQSVLESANQQSGSLREIVESCQEFSDSERKELLLTVSRGSRAKIENYLRGIINNRGMGWVMDRCREDSLSIAFAAWIETVKGFDSFKNIPFAAFVCRYIGVRIAHNLARQFPNRDIQFYHIDEVSERVFAEQLSVKPSTPSAGETITACNSSTITATWLTSGKPLPAIAAELGVSHATAWREVSQLIDKIFAEHGTKRPKRINLDAFRSVLQSRGDAKSPSRGTSILD